MSDDPNDPIPAERQVGQREQQALAAMRAYREKVGHDPVAMRCALGDAAHLIDAIRADLQPLRPLRGENGRRAEAVARALKHAADAIWLMRDEIQVGALLRPPSAQAISRVGGNCACPDGYEVICRQGICPRRDTPRAIRGGLAKNLGVVSVDDAAVAVTKAKEG
jgi:hypothetical protein